jgi:hypothetical protein
MCINKKGGLNCILQNLVAHYIPTVRDFNHFQQININLL